MLKLFVTLKHNDEIVGTLHFISYRAGMVLMDGRAMMVHEVLQGTGETQALLDLPVILEHPPSSRW